MKIKIYKRRWFKALTAILLVLIVAFSAFYIYTLDYYRSDALAIEAMQQTQSVSVQQGKNMVIFKPKTSSGTGFIFYPGGKVEYTAYAPLMMDLSRSGVTCVLLKMPFNLAVFDVNGADRAIAAVPEIKTWYVGGHSLGGAMASSYAEKNSQKISGIVFLGAYPSSDLSHTKLKALSIYGTNDRVLNRQKFNDSKTNAPEQTRFYEITGGNHAYYGTYGEQKGDGTAEITPEEQQKITSSQISDLIVS